MSRGSAMLREDKPVVRAVPAYSIDNKCNLCYCKGRCIEWDGYGKSPRVLSPLRCYGSGELNGIYFKLVQR